jgi:hypothetical protein
VSTSALRASAVLALAGFAVHQARYAIAPDDHGAAVHGYLAAAPVVLALLLTLALGRSLAALAARAPAARRPVSRTSAAGALLALHAAQEIAERALAGGGVIDAGALLAVPLCLAAGAVVAPLLRTADRLLDDAAAAAAPAAPRLVPLAAPAALLLPRRAPAPRRHALARHLAGRAPPALG